MIIEHSFVRGYEDDAGDDVIFTEHVMFRPGFNVINLPVQYTPEKDEVAFLVARGSTADKGIFPISVAIDTGYEGTIRAWVVNVSSETVVFNPGERAFSIVNFVKALSRAKNLKVTKPGQKRGTNAVGSSGR